MMPYVNIKVTGGSEAPSAEQKAELIRGVTELLARVLNKNPQCFLGRAGRFDWQLPVRAGEAQQDAAFCGKAARKKH